ncbi:pyruvate ferredoxin oxidoreductase [bacterium]|nr:pyruvate ferredoxin oxidoreductase [bacterium]
MKKNNKKQTAQILEGSQAIALTIKNINPGVISAYPITPQTHIVEDLAKFKADGEADYEYVRAESEFAAASIVEGASAQGIRVYSATSSQGILLMTEVLFNIAGMRLPVVITCANRGVSAPITIWNDHQDAMTIRDAGFLMFFAENHQEAVEQHILAYKIAEKLRLPAMVNIDGFILTHSYEKVKIPSASEIKKFLPDLKVNKNQSLNPESPVTMGAFATPEHYMEIREELHNDLSGSLELIQEEYKKLNKTINLQKVKYNKAIIDNGLVEYYGPKNPKTLIIGMGSMMGTVKEYSDKDKRLGVLKIKTFRPFPEEEIKNIFKRLKPKNIAVLDKSISLGYMGILASEVKAISQQSGSVLKTNKINIKIQSFIVGLGGRDITQESIKRIAHEVNRPGQEMIFIKK